MDIVIGYREQLALSARKIGQMRNAYEIGDQRRLSSNEASNVLAESKDG